MSYPEKFRERVLEPVEERSVLGEIAEKFKIGRTTLCCWIKKESYA